MDAKLKLNNFFYDLMKIFFHVKFGFVPNSDQKKRLPSEELIHIMPKDKIHQISDCING